MAHVVGSGTAVTLSSKIKPIGTLRLSLRNDPRQNGLHRGEAWIIRLSNDRKQLKPQIIVGMFDEFANRTCGKIRHGHGRRVGAALELPRYARNQGGDSGNTSCARGRW